MAKGDHRRVQDQIRTQQGIAQNNMGQVNNQLGRTAGEIGGYYSEGAGRNIADYDTIMQGYQNLGGGGGADGGGSLFNEAAQGYRGLTQGDKYGWDPLFKGALSKSIGTFGEFADTGGFSDQDIQNIRARNIAPTRSVFSSAQRGLNQNRSLGGFSPNYAAASAKLTRDLASTIGDMNVNTNAGIAEMVAQNRLAGAGGLSAAGIGGQGQDTAINGLNLQALLAGLGGLMSVGSAKAGAGAAGRANDLAALRGMTDLYGTSPALAHTFGNQLLGANGQLLEGAGLQNNLSMGGVNNQYNGAQIPGNFANTMQGINSVLPIASQIAGAFAGLGGNKPPNTRTFNADGWSA